MREAWSPEQIRGRLPREHGQTISHEWMYQDIYQDKRAGGDLYRTLLCQKARRKRYGPSSRRGRIANQVSIDERHVVVMTRQRLGDREGDTVIGKGHCGALVTLVKRQSKYTVLQGVQHKTAAAVRTAVARGLRPHKARVQTITYDHGRECSKHAGLARISRRGSTLRIRRRPGNGGENENTTGLIRQYFPKDLDLTRVTDHQFAAVRDTLQHRPRKSLGYRTPPEVFFDTTTSLTVALTS